MTDPTDDLDLSAVPLFPLPGVVLFPVAVLPLHIFEDRYRAMTADALAGNRLIAMALLRPGWEKTYYGRPEIESVVCVGRILSHEMLPDGKFNLLLQGQVRATVVHEWRSGAAEPSYRLAELKRLEESDALEIDLEPQRRQFIELFEQSALRHRGVARQFRQIARGVMPTPVVADLAAFTFLDDVGLKQSLLAESDVRGRIGRIIAALQQTAADAAWFADHISAVSAPQDPRMN